MPQSLFYTCPLPAWVSAEHDVPWSPSPLPSFLPPWCTHPAPTPLAPASLAWGRGKTCVCLCTDPTTLSQPSATTPQDGGEGTRSSPPFPILPCPPRFQVLPPNWSQASGTGPSGAGAGQHPISGAPFLSSSCAPCRLTGPGDGPQPQLTATHTAELSHVPWGGLTLGTASG